MKFSLKHLILFVTFAAILCGVGVFAFNRIRAAEAKFEAQLQYAQDDAAIHRQVSEKLSHRFGQFIRDQKAQTLDTERSKHTFLHWNVESGGNDRAIIVKQLIALGRYNIIGLSEVAKPEIYEQAINQNWPGRYGYIRGTTGRSDKLLILYDKKKFEHVESADMHEAGGVVLDNGRHRAPLYAHFKDLNNDQELIVILNHLARGDAEYRAEQATGLREWARTKSVPIVAIGDYHFDYDFKTQKGNSGFEAFMKDGVWKWIQPEPMIDSNWSDNGKGGDRYPDSMLDFSFVAGAAKDWKAEGRVIVRDGDFPDNEKASVHRPVELILSN